MLDTEFASGSTFLGIWQAWRTRAGRPSMLHYVGVLSGGEASQLQAALFASTTATSDIAELRDSLGRNCYGLLPGFHRILLEGGQLSLTLCVGDWSDALSKQEMQADCLLASATGQPWDKWTLKALARCCRRDTQIYFSGTPLPSLALLMDAGFVPLAKATDSPDSHPTLPSTLLASFNPRWQLRNRRRPAATTTPTGRCAVIGAGIAGASVARALAVRGWHVDVYDAQPACAGGASGLPVGLVVPHHSADDSPRSRLSRSGTRLTLQHAGHLLQAGQDWNPGGVLELSVEETDLADAEAEVLSQAAAQQAPTGWSSRMNLGTVPGLWHPHAGWIKPARLVQQWLNHERIHFHGAAAVHTLQRALPHWLLRDANGVELGRADRVVFANA